MKVTITYEDGSWVFEVVSTGDEDTYCEQFEVTDLSDAQDAAWDLMEELAKHHDPIADAFGDLFDDEE